MCREKPTIAPMLCPEKANGISRNGPSVQRHLQSYAELSSIFFLRLSGRMSVQTSSM